MTDRPLDGLSDAKRALLAKRLAERAAARTNVIPPRPLGIRLPLASAQEEFWLQEERAAAGLTANNIVMAWRVRGALDLAALQRAFDALVARHEVLRTTYILGAEGPEQRVGDPRAVTFQQVDLRTASGDRVAQARATLATWARRTSDLKQDQLLRAGIVTLTDDDQFLMVVVHHIAVDGISDGVLREELSALYAAEKSGTAPSLAPVQVQFADYAVWERDSAQQVRFAAQLDHWRKRLAGAPEGLDLPLDRPRPNTPSYAGDTRAVTLSPAVLEGVRSLGHQQQVTTFMVLYAGFAAVLARYTGQDDLVIGVPVAGRNRPELQSAVGLYANAVGIRADLSQDPTFVELLSRVRSQTLDAFDDQDVPFAQVTEALRFDGRPANSLLFQVMFSLQNDLAKPTSLSGVTLEPEGVRLDGTKLELTLLASERPEGLRLALEYRTELFDAETAERIVHHLGALVADAVANPTRRVSELALMDDCERELLLHTWNDTDAEWPENATLHGLFEEQVRARPDAIAVQCDDVRLTYAELDRRANRLAWALREKGVRPDSLVAIFMEKSVDTVAAILGVLKSGGAYVPLDTVYPDDRIAFMLSDSEAQFVITEAALESRVQHTRAQVMLASDCWSRVDARSDAPPASAGPHNLCYVIYTSGSTGRPKGVLIEHRNVVRLIFNSRFQFEFSERDVWTIFHSFAFDFSVWEMYGALLRGGRAIVVPRAVAQRASEFVSLLEREQVTVLNQVPSAFLALMEEEVSQSKASLGLRYVIFGGEALQPSVLAPWQERYPSTTLINMFGITETTVHVTFKEIGPREIADGASNIGAPIPTLTTYVLDERLQLVPIGVTGEICVGGAGVARGYLKRPELTAERFVAHPFRAGQRLYRSGDLGRMRANGEIEYLGRRDAQVKLRGFRIELGEIEATLAKHAAVSQNAVVLREERGGEVVAYVVPDADSAGTVRRLAGLDAKAQTRPRLRLANGLTVFQRNPAETEVLFKEVFEGDGFLQHGLEIVRGDTVFDVGANIGLFTLFAGMKAPGVLVYAFEMNPAVVAVLQANTELYGVPGRVFACQVGRRDERMNAPDERSTRSLSGVMREERIDRIDLLKVDVANAEADVLRSIDDADWPKIQQVILKVSDIDGRLAHVTAVLERHGFQCVVHEKLADSTRSRVYARRTDHRRTGGATAAAQLAQWRTAAELRAELNASLRRDLPAYMVPAAIVFLDALPLTSSGKLDRRALPAPQREPSPHDLTPEGPVEEVVASVWRQALQNPNVGRHASFFELGGHSLLVTRVIAALAKLIRIQLPIRTMFDTPTVAGIAAALVSRETVPGQTVRVAQLVLKLQAQSAASATASNTVTQTGSHA
ncbi:MAG: amino acid adenylation domain-containing protein [Gemmatimonadaceae bacterium]